MCHKHGSLKISGDCIWLDARILVHCTRIVGIFSGLKAVVQTIARLDYNAYKDNILKQEHNPELLGTKADVNQVLFSYLD